jgi:exopolysaccharide biosynthesis polyprenyl glycosylphosphotransferase
MTKADAADEFSGRTDAAVGRAVGLSRLASGRRAWRDSVLRRFLAIADLVAAATGTLALAVGFRSSAATALWAAFAVPGWLLLSKLHGLYDRDHRALRHLTVDEFASLVAWSISGTGMTVLFLLVTPSGSLDAVAAVELFLVVLTSAFILRSAARFVWRRITPPERTVIVGEGPLADATRRKMELFPEIHAVVVAQHASLEIDDLNTWPEALQDVDRIIVASQRVDERLIQDLVVLCRRALIKLSVVPPLRGIFGTAVQLNHIADLPVIEYNTWDVSRSSLLLKRVLDVGLSVVALAAVAPLLLVISLAIAVDSRGPVLFRQRRAGLLGEPFTMIKFRTMVVDAEERLPALVPFDDLSEPMFKLRRDPRVTRVGRILRRTSLDELPQLCNILVGQMSLVGPRPEQIELIELYRAEHRFRLDVKPGLTGPMQVHGRGQLTFEERLAVEREYIENYCISRDFRILALTLASVVSGKGAY